MGPPPDPEDMARMLQNPQFASALNEALSNPALVENMIQQNPLLRDMGPQMRQMLQSPEFRRMMTDPEQMRSMMQMQRMFGGGPFGMGGGGSSGNNAFPAPGVTDTTPASHQQQNQTQQQAQQRAAPFNPFAAFTQAQGQGNQPPANPFASLFNPALFGNTPAQTPPAAASTGQGTPTGQDTTTTATTQETTTAPSSNPPNTTQPSQSQNQPQFPFPNPNLMYNPQLLQNLLSSMTQNTPPTIDPTNPQQQSGSTPAAAGAGAGAEGGSNANPFAALMNPWLVNALEGNTSQTQSPPDTRPAEERYAEQLRQLNEMGFYEFERNVEALRRSGGSVQGAVEYLLTH